MKIMIIGSVLAEQLSKEKHEVTLVDRSGVRLDQSNNELDVMVVEGDGASREVQLEAGADQADLVIACTGADELNLLCCLIGKKLGARHTIARVRNPMYVEELNLIKDDLGLSMAINPEEACATEMARVLRFPSAIKIDTFARGHVEILKTGVTAGSPLDGMALKDIGKFRANVLICAVERGERDVIIPSGEFQLKAGDRISVVASPQEAQRFFRQVGVAKTRVRQVMLIGGGRMGYYLARQLLATGMDVKIIESDAKRCEELSQLLPEATILHGDGTDHDLLESEGIFDADAFVSLTGRDEENLLMALTAKDSGVAKVLPKMSRPNYTALVHDLGIDTVISPKDVTASQISSYVRGLANSQGSAVESLHKILGGAMEAVEFTATGATHFLNTPLKDLNFKPGLLVAAIVHGGKLLIPGGHSIISEGDRVIVVAKSLFLKDLNDILVR